MSQRERRSPTRDDAGFTLAEMMVAISIFLTLLVLVLSGTITVSRALKDTRQFTAINEQARVATERLTRELRQASEILAVSIPSTTDGPAMMTFGVDFNGNRRLDDVAADPEVLTYRYDPTDDQLTLTANDAAGDAVTQPILSDDVTGFTLDYRSSLWQYDTNADGITSWTEIDATTGVGNKNGVLDAPELAKIDLVVISLTVLKGTHRQTYQTEVGLRNQAQS
ncbi:PulJ/GspJ family protein [Nocardioides rubriscoriae]|uniref:PulJ/GspJ family protein n=1 Tax=Nocardioides rubriscoriae TaxID=642762 RepID=UPI0011DFD64E|nr:prepilin-type N-terminal cleavage/methylation domain-containing protein [Nocardioides rubriscoriae]